MENAEEQVVLHKSWSHKNCISLNRKNIDAVKKMQL